jgi:hypothetical protein
VASVSIAVCSNYRRVNTADKAPPPDISAISALTAVKHGNSQFTPTASQPGTHQKIIDMAMRRWIPEQPPLWATLASTILTI